MAGKGVRRRDLTVVTVKGRGPKPSGGTQDQKSTISVRIPAELKEKLFAATQANDRSLSQEAEVRLELSIRGARVLDEALELAFGRKLSAVLLMLGRIIKDADHDAAILSSRDDSTPQGDWLSSAYIFDQVQRAISLVLNDIKPDGDPVPPALEGRRHEWFGQDISPIAATIGERVAATLLDAIIDPAEAVRSEFGSWAQPLREKLGDEVVRRIKERERGI